MCPSLMSYHHFSTPSGKAVTSSSWSGITKIQYLLHFFMHVPNGIARGEGLSSSSRRGEELAKVMRDTEGSSAAN